MAMLRLFSFLPDAGLRLPARCALRVSSCFLSLFCSSSVLYQRGVYHPDGFAREAKYGITTLVTTDEGLKKYLDNVIRQLKGKRSRKLYIVLNSKSYISTPISPLGYSSIGFRIRSTTHIG